MKIELLREDLLYAVNAVERAVSTKNTLPVLSGIMISAKGNQLSFRATDLEIAIECIINAAVEEEGELVAPGRKLSALAKGLSSGPVSYTHLDVYKRQSLTTGAAKTSANSSRCQGCSVSEVETTALSRCFSCRPCSLISRANRARAPA